MAVTVTAIAKTPLRLTLLIDNPGGDNIGSIVRGDGNGTRTVRAESGQLPSTAATLTVQDYEYALLYRSTITYTVYSATKVVLGSVRIDAAHPLFNTQRGLLHITVPQRPAESATFNAGDGGRGAVLIAWDDTRQARSTVHAIVGREDPIVVLQRSSYRTGRFVLRFPSLYAAQRAESALARGQVLFLRQSDQWVLSAYFVAAGTTLTPLERPWADSRAAHAGLVDQPEHRWDLAVDFTEVAWPTGYVVPVTVWTYNDVLNPANGYGDYNALAASFGSYADLLDRNPIEG